MSKLLEQIEDPALTPFEQLVKLLAILRSPEGCNWDRKQTHESLVPYLIEESYEVVDAIERKHYPALREELGDLAVQLVFHAQLAAERGEFTIHDALSDVVTKLINRHPHVFGERKDLNPQQVRDQWEQIKTSSGEKDSVLGGIPLAMPALTMAFRIGEKAGGVGFDWSKADDVFDKIAEEIAELRQELDSSQRDKDMIANEIGDLLFAVASLARKLDIEPETALRSALKKFRTRFNELEKRVTSGGNKFTDFSLQQLESLWQQIKIERESD
jgi:tetrapyrrole methylase family protein/MazG family protein